MPFAMEPVVYDFAINEQGTQAALYARRRCPDARGLLHPAGSRRSIRTEIPRLSPVRRAELERFTAACRSKGGLRRHDPNLFDHLLPAAQDAEGRPGTNPARPSSISYGFDRLQHEQIRQDLRSGRIGLAQNRLPATRLIEDAAADRVDDRHRAVGLEALAGAASPWCLWPEAWARAGRAAPVS